MDTIRKLTVCLLIAGLCSCTSSNRSLQTGEAATSSASFGATTVTELETELRLRMELDKRRKLKAQAEPKKLLSLVSPFRERAKIPSVSLASLSGGESGLKRFGGQEAMGDFGAVSSQWDHNKPSAMRLTSPYDDNLLRAKDLDPAYFDNPAFPSSVRNNLKEQFESGKLIIEADEKLIEEILDSSGYKQHTTEQLIKQIGSKWFLIHGEDNRFLANQIVPMFKDKDKITLPGSGNGNDSTLRDMCLEELNVRHSVAALVESDRHDLRGEKLILYCSPFRDCDQSSPFSRASKAKGRLGTGFWIGRDQFVTAAHNFGDSSTARKENVKNRAFVFGFESSKDTKVKLDPENIYFCKSLREVGRDIAVVTVDREVLANSGKINRPELIFGGEEVLSNAKAIFSWGHSTGLPLQFSGKTSQFGGSKRSPTMPTDRESFATKLDVFKGASGSPVFATTGDREVRLVGMVSQSCKYLMVSPNSRPKGLKEVLDIRPDDLDIRPDYNRQCYHFTRVTIDDPFFTRAEYVNSQVLNSPP